MKKIADALRSRAAQYLKAWKEDPDNENYPDLIKLEIYNELADILEVTPEPLQGEFEGMDVPQNKYSKKGYQSYQAKSEM